jgi:hypothetical protein
MRQGPVASSGHSRKAAFPCRTRGRAPPPHPGDGRGRHGSPGRPCGPPSGPRPTSIRERCPSGAPPARPCWLFHAAFPATSTRTRAVLFVLRSRLTSPASDGCLELVRCASSGWASNRAPRPGYLTTSIPEPVNRHFSATWPCPPDGAAATNRRTRTAAATVADIRCDSADAPSFQAPTCRRGLGAIRSIRPPGDSRAPGTGAGRPGTAARSSADHGAPRQSSGAHRTLDKRALISLDA